MSESVWGGGIFPFAGQFQFMVSSRRTLHGHHNALSLLSAFCFHAHPIGRAVPLLPTDPLQPFFCAEDGGDPAANVSTPAANDTDLAAATAAATALLPGHRRRLHRTAAAAVAQPPSAVNILLTTLRPLNITVDEEALTVDVDAGVRVRPPIGRNVCNMSSCLGGWRAQPWPTMQACNACVQSMGGPGIPRGLQECHMNARVKSGRKHDTHPPQVIDTTH